MRVDHLDVLGERSQITAVDDLSDLAVLDQQCSGAVPTAGRVNKVGISEGEGAGQSSNLSSHFSAFGGA